jgi:hypothetical protein
MGKTTVETILMKLTAMFPAIHGSSNVTTQEDAFPLDGLATGMMIVVITATKIHRFVKQRAVIRKSNSNVKQVDDAFRAAGIVILMTIAVTDQMNRRASVKPVHVLPDGADVKEPL